MKCRHLQQDELDRLLTLHIDDSKLRFVRDMFAFSTFTGLSYADLSTLGDEHLITEADGSVWIRKLRSLHI